MPLSRTHKLGMAAAALALLVAGGLRAGRSPAEFQPLAWQDLVPTGEAPAQSGLIYDRVTPESVPADPRALQPKAAQMVAGLDGRQVSLAGYVVPLEFEGTKVRQFLLVPFYGACIHVPPPPANQIVLVRLDRPVEVEADFLPVRVSGRLRVAGVATQLADAGYQMVAREMVRAD